MLRIDREIPEVFLTKAYDSFLGLLLRGSVIPAFPQDCAFHNLSKGDLAMLIFNGGSRVMVEVVEIGGGLRSKMKDRLRGKPSEKLAFRVVKINGKVAVKLV